MDAPTTRRQIDSDGERTASVLAWEIAQHVDEILGVKHAIVSSAPATESETVIATCSCGSGIPAVSLDIAGKSVEVIGLPLIFEDARQNGKSVEQVFETVKVYNAIPAEFESAYREAILLAYAAFIAPLEKQEA